MADNTVSVDVELAIKKAQADLDKLSGRFDTFATKAEKSLGGVDKAFGSLKVTIGLAAAAMGGVAVTAVTRFAASMVNDGVKAAQQYEDALNSFNVALQLSGNYSAEASRDFEEFASSIQKTTKYSDDATLSAGALIANISGLGGAPLKNATQAALDLSAALKIDLQTAAQLVGKAAAGETGTLSRYGIIIGETGTKAEKAARALELIQSKFGGAAVKDAQTYTGATTQLSNAYDDLRKQVGFIITMNPQVIRAINELSSVFLRLAGGIQDNQQGLGRLVSEGMVRFVYTLSLSASWVDVLYRGLRFVYQFFDPFIQGLAAVGAALVGNFSGAWQFLQQSGQAIADFNKNLFEETPLSKFAVEAEALARSMQASIGIIAEETKAKGQEVSASLAQSEIDYQQKAAAAREAGAAREKALQAQRMTDTKSSLGVIATLQQGHIKELFGIGKAAALAQATINGFEAVTKAFAIGGPLGFILGPLVAAATAVQIAGIAAQQPGFATGGIVGGNSTTGDRVPIRVNSREAVLTLDQQQNLFNAINSGNLGGGGGGVVVNVEGNVIVDSPSRIDEFIERINERVKFGNTPLYASGVV